MSGPGGGRLPGGSFGNVFINGGTPGNDDASVTVGASATVNKRGATRVLLAREPAFTVTGFRGGRLPNGTFGRVTTGSGTFGQNNGYVIIDG